MSEALLKETDEDDPMSYALHTLDPETFLRQFGFSQTLNGFWRRVNDGYEHHVTLEDGKIYYSIYREGYTQTPISAGRCNDMAEFRKRVQMESLDDDMDVESYVEKSLNPAAALAELGFKLRGDSADGTKSFWLRRLGRGFWQSAVVNNTDGTIHYRKIKRHGRGSLNSEFTVYDHTPSATLNDVRRKVLKWKHEDAREVVARLLDSTADNPDAFEPHAVLELMTPHRCPVCQSHNISSDIAEGVSDCYNCGTAFNADRIQEDDLDPDDAAAFINRLPLVQPRITVSFSRTTPESSAQGAASEHGWIDEEGVDMTPDSFDYDEGISAVDKAIKFLKDQGAVHPSASHFHPDVWYSTEYQTINYATGEDEERNFHLKDFSPAEQQQIWDAMKRR